MSTTTTQEEIAKRVFEARVRAAETEIAAASAIEEAVDSHWEGNLWDRDNHNTLRHAGLMHVEYARALLDLAREVRKDAREIEAEGQNIDVETIEAARKLRAKRREAARAAANVRRLRGIPE